MRIDYLLLPTLEECIELSGGEVIPHLVGPFRSGTTDCYVASYVPPYADSYLYVNGRNPDVSAQFLTLFRSGALRRIAPPLPKIHFAGMDLSGFDLDKIDMNRWYFEDCNLRSISFKSCLATFDRCDLSFSSFDVIPNTGSCFGSSIRIDATACVIEMGCNSFQLRSEPSRLIDTMLIKLHGEVQLDRNNTITTSPSQYDVLKRIEAIQPKLEAAEQFVVLTNWLLSLYRSESSFRFGTEVELVGCAFNAIRDRIEALCLSGATKLWWRVVHDMSVAAELVSEPCLDPEGMEHDLKTIAREIRAYSKESGRKCDVASQHVHVGTFDRSVAGKAAKWGWKNQNKIWRKYRPKPSREKYTRRLDADTVNLDERSINNDSHRYRWINLYALDKHGTIEFRLFNGSNRASKMADNCRVALEWTHDIISSAGA